MKEDQVEQFRPLISKELLDGTYKRLLENYPDRDVRKIRDPIDKIAVRSIVDLKGDYSRDLIGECCDNGSGRNWLSQGGAGILFKMMIIRLRTQYIKAMLGNEDYAQYLQNS